MRKGGITVISRPAEVTDAGRVSVIVSGERRSYSGRAGREMVRMLADDRVNVRFGCTIAFQPLSSDCEELKAARKAATSGVATNV